MNSGKQILDEVKAADKQRKEEAKAAVKPWYINFAVWLVDAVSIVVILAFAVIGVRSLIVHAINPEYALGAGIVVVLGLAFRIIEKIYRHRS